MIPPEQSGAEHGGRMDRFWGTIEAWSKPVITWTLIFAALWFSPAIIKMVAALLGVE